MTGIAQGLHKTTAVGKQVALGTPKVGAGGQILRRVTSIFSATRTMYANNEIVSHMQDTGVTYGQKNSGGKLTCVLSPGTYQTLFAAIMRAGFNATSPMAAGVDVTAAATGPQFVDASAGFLTAGLKVGDVGRWTGFTTPGDVNNAKNFWITGLTAGNMTGKFLTDSIEHPDPVVAKAAGDSVTFTVVGKKVMAPMTAQTNDFLTFEEWYSDLSKSEVFSDMKVNQIQVTAPATGNATLNADIVGIGVRTLAGAESFTTPAAETTTDVVQSVHGAILVNGTLVTVANSMQITIDSGIAPVGAVIGSNLSPDLNQGRLKVAGTFSALFKDTDISTLYDAETKVSLAVVMASATTGTADFIGFTMGKVSITGDAPDDGEKSIMRTYPFTAELNGQGGALVAFDETILTVQDSAAV